MHELKLEIALLRPRHEGQLGHSAPQRPHLLWRPLRRRVRAPPAERRTPLGRFFCPLPLTQSHSRSSLFHFSSFASPEFSCSSYLRACVRPLGRLLLLQSDDAVVMGSSAGEEKAIADLTGNKAPLVPRARVVIQWHFAQRELARPAMQALLGMVNNGTQHPTEWKCHACASPVRNGRCVEFRTRSALLQFIIRKPPPASRFRLVVSLQEDETQTSLAAEADKLADELSLTEKKLQKRTKVHAFRMHMRTPSAMQ
jgi:hypothetical protein